MTNTYYQKHQEKLQKEARERYQNLSEEEKDKRQKKARDRYQNLSEEKEKKCQYHCEHNKTLSEEEKQKQVEYMRNYYLAHKICFELLCRSFRDPRAIKFISWISP